MSKWWQQVLAHIRAGEAALIKIQREANARFPKLMVGRVCSAANGIIGTWKGSIKTAMAAFYKQDATWKYPVYTGP